MKGVKRNNKCRTCGGFGHNQRSCNISKASGSDKATQENNEMNRCEPTAPQNYSEMNIGDIESAPQTWSLVRLHKGFDLNDYTWVIRQRATGVTNISSSNRISSVNVHKVLNKQTNVIVKDGRNFVTVPNLRASLDDQRKSKQEPNVTKLLDGFGTSG